MTAIYLPELILAEASAFVTSFEDEFLLEKSLPVVLKCMKPANKVIEPLEGDHGEIAIAVGLMYTLDAIRASMFRNEVKRTVALNVDKDMARDATKSVDGHVAGDDASRDEASDSDLKGKFCDSRYDF